MALPFYGSPNFFSYISKKSGTASMKNKQNAASVEIDTADGNKLKYNQGGTIATVMDSVSSGSIKILQAAFVEDATTLTHTATFPIPQGALLLDIYFLSTVLWTGGGTVQFTCGDANSATGWFTATNLKATDLLLGERLQASNANNWGGVNGAYLSTAGRFGQQSTTMIGGFALTAASVIMVVTESAPSTTAGRSFGYVVYATGTSVAPVKA